MESQDEKSIEQLQKEKILLEIHDLNKAWYKRKDYLQIALPTTVALFSLIYAIVSGFFSSKYEQYQLQKEQLRLEVLYFEKKKEELIKSNEGLSVANAKLLASLDEQTRGILMLKGQLTAKQQDIVRKELDLNILKSQTAYYDTAISTLQSEYDSKKQKFQGEYEKQLVSEAELNRIVKEKNTTIGNLQNEISDLNHKLRLCSENPFIPKDKKDRYVIWINEEMSKYYDQKIKNSEMSIKRLDEQMKAAEKRSDTISAQLKAQKIVN